MPLPVLRCQTVFKNLLGFLWNTKLATPSAGLPWPLNCYRKKCKPEMAFPPFCCSQQFGSAGRFTKGVLVSTGPPESSSTLQIIFLKSSFLLSGRMIMGVATNGVATKLHFWDIGNTPVSEPLFYMDLIWYNTLQM